MRFSDFGSFETNEPPHKFKI